jgi:IclR family mhp operon transcriptional activator
VAELARVTSIHRTTVRRLLETLASAGYVQSSASDGQFFVTLRVRDLSEGFTDREWISGVAAPVMGELLRKMRWPSDLTTLDGAAMFIRESTHRFSPLSFERAMVGIRMPLLLTASGRAYLAACDKEEQEQLIRLAASDPEQAAIATNRKLVSQMIAQVRKQGYASNEGDWHKGSRTSALAVAVHGHGRVLGLPQCHLREARGEPEGGLCALPAAAARSLARDRGPAGAGRGGLGLGGAGAYCGCRPMALATLPHCTRSLRISSRSSAESPRASSKPAFCSDAFTSGMSSTRRTESPSFFTMGAGVASATRMPPQIVDSYVG